MNLLGLIAAAENMRLESVYSRYGGLDMLPRLNMAINLAREAKWNRNLVHRIEAMRKEIQNSLLDKRNMFVHGVHKAGPKPGETILTMVRWKGDKRDQTVTLLDALDLANRLAKLAGEAQSIYEDYGVWKFGPDHQANGPRQIAGLKAATRFIRAQQVKRALKLLWTNLKPF